MQARTRKGWQLVTPIAAVALTAGLWSSAATAQETWNPFRGKDEAAARRRSAPSGPAAAPLPPMQGPAARDGDAIGTVASQPSFGPGFGTAYPGSEAPPPYARALPGTAEGDPRATGATASVFSKIERLELEPAMASDGSGLPQDAWRGMDIKAVEAAFASLNLPPRSAALHGLWQRLLLAAVDAPEGVTNPAHFDAVRLEALYRSGLLGGMDARLQGAAAADPVMTAFAIRRDLALGRTAEACQAGKTLAGARSIPVALTAELRVLTGYCAALAGDQAGAGLAAEMARDEGLDAPLALSVLDALAGNSKAGLAIPKLVRVLDYRMLELLGPIDPAQVLDKAEPALLAAIALNDKAEPRTRVMAGEAAARLHALTAEQLRAIYDTVPAGAEDPALRRAELVRLIASEQAPARKLKLMKSALDDARTQGLLGPVGRVLAPMLAGIVVPTDRGQAETAVEVLALAGDIRRAREFVQAGSVWHWLPLLDIAESAPSEAQREQNLGSLDSLVQQRRLPADLLHRLATVLDATDVNVPLPLWDAAGRAPQPANGYLPETGVLAQLQDAAKRRDVARTILLSLRALGPATAESVHIIALGDTIRALRRVGLDADARRLGVEALIAQWPHGGTA